MKRILLLFTIILLPCAAALAQDKYLPVDTETGKVKYADTILVNEVQKELHRKAKLWAVLAREKLPTAEVVSLGSEKDPTVKLDYTLILETDDNDYIVDKLTFTITISCKKNSCICLIDNMYREKKGSWMWRRDDGAYLNELLRYAEASHKKTISSETITLNQKINHTVSIIFESLKPIMTASDM